jgi:hypothetical protein
MTHYSLLTTCATAVTFAFSFSSCQDKDRSYDETKVKLKTEDTRPPNIILIVSDDQGYNRVYI